MPQDVDRDARAAEDDVIHVQVKQRRDDGEARQYEDEPCEHRVADDHRRGDDNCGGNHVEAEGESGGDIACGCLLEQRRRAHLRRRDVRQGVRRLRGSRHLLTLDELGRDLLHDRQCGDTVGRQAVTDEEELADNPKEQGRAEAFAELAQGGVLSGGRCRDDDRGRDRRPALRARHAHVLVLDNLCQVLDRPQDALVVDVARDKDQAVAEDLVGEEGPKVAGIIHTSLQAGECPSCDPAQRKQEGCKVNRERLVVLLRQLLGERERRARPEAYSHVAVIQPPTEHEPHDHRHQVDEVLPLEWRAFVSAEDHVAHVRLHDHLLADGKRFIILGIGTVFERHGATPTGSTRGGQGERRRWWPASRPGTTLRWSCSA
mmetsp:Transcript_6781/g.17586  ORF Transcript_6781/g.17586 Transcript_6781/m.17586 type:complete len:374 (-) Transcript_6781:1-1122(-)